MTDRTATAMENWAMTKKIDLLPYIMAAVTVVVLFMFLLFPILKTLTIAFIDFPAAIDLQNLTFANFERFVQPGTYQSALWHSIVVSVLTTVVATTIALPAAYAVTRVAMPFRTLILSLSVISIISPPFIGAYAWVILLGRSGIISHFLRSWFGIELPSIYGLFGIVLALSLHYFPYVFLIVQGALAAADPDIEHSAQVMGAGRFRILRTITFPLVLPAIGAGAMIVFIKALGNFGVPAILGGEYYVLPTLIYFQVHGYFNLNAASAIALVNVALTLLALLVLTRVNRTRRFVTVTSGTRRSAKLTGFGARVFANAYVWILLVLALIPQIVVFLTSFAERWVATLFPSEYGLGNYLRVLSDVSGPILDSLALAGAATILCVVFGTLAAYSAARQQFVGKWALDLTIMLPFVLPGIVTGVAFINTFNDGWLVLTGTGSIIVFAYFIRRIAYIFRTVTAAVTQVDTNLEEASRICGATWGTTMRRITVPLIAPGILAGAILVFSTLITELNVTIMLYSAKWRPISVAIFERIMGTSAEIPEAAALGSIAIVMTLILVFVASRLIGKSMADMFR